MIQNDEHLLSVLRYIEANPLRAEIVSRAEDYPWSSYRLHGCGEADELLDRLVNYEQLSPHASGRHRAWQKLVHRPIEEQTLSAIRRSSATGLPYGQKAWVNRLAKRLDLDLTMRPRGRPRKATTTK